MIIVMKPNSTAAEIGAVIASVQKMGASPHPIYGEERTVVAVVGETRRISPQEFIKMPGVEKLTTISAPFKLASRESHPDDTTFRVGGYRIGGPEIIIMAGPCSVESRSQLLETAHAVKEAGAHILRGGAFKPRSSPYSFQGLGEEGLKYLAEARETYNMPIITEVMAPEEVDLVASYADILQIGARNMQNYRLLQAVGRVDRPIFLKRGLSGTIQELLMSAEYVMASGNPNVMLVERGIRTYETYTRNTFDINAIPSLKQLSHLPVIGDPSHGTGKWRLVGPIAKAAIAAGADGLMIEVHPRPSEAFSDGAQSLKPKRFQALMDDLRVLAGALGRTL
jgi:3-deoxy-7-phosphoheptulonate synthase